MSLTQVADERAAAAVQRAQPAYVSAEAMARALEQQAAEENKDEHPEYLPCRKVLWCGHICKGVLGESECLPCLHPTCQEKLVQVAMECAQTEQDREYAKSLALINAGHEELCGICYTTELGSEPCIKMCCRHVFHASCLSKILKHRYSTLKISFGYLDCPSCKQEFQIPYYVPGLTEKLREGFAYKDNLEHMAIEKAKEEGLDKKGPVVEPGNSYFGKLRDYAIHQCTFYECYKCQVIYFGGLQDCADAMGAEQNMKKEDLFCTSCQTEELGLGQEMCEKHGNQFIDYKCKYCCSVAMFVCVGAAEYFCQPCHNDAMNGGRHNPKTDCEGGQECPLGIPYHPKASRAVNQSRFALGCSLCRSEKLNLIQNREDGEGGFNVERRDSMKKRFDKVLGHDAGREMRIVQQAPADWQPKRGTDGKKKREVITTASAKCCTIF